MNDRRIPLPGSTNFRDLGGYLGADNRPVKPRKIYRSGKMSELRHTESSLWDELEVTDVIDFRSGAEAKKSPSVFPPDAVVNLHNIPVVPGNLAEYLAKHQGHDSTSPQAMITFMRSINRNFVMEQREKFRKFFSIILQSQGSVVFHCTAGKDRTGFAAAMFLAALGVSRPQIMQDYLLTGQYYSPEEEFEWFCIRYELDLDFEVIKPVLMVDETYLGTAFETIDKEYGSFDSYLASIGVGDAEKSALRARFLES